MNVSRPMAVEDALRLAAPDARTYWVGRPGGLPPGSLVAVAISLAIVAVHAALQHWLTVDGWMVEHRGWVDEHWVLVQTAATVRHLSILGTPPAILGMALWAGLALRDHWRTRCYVTSAGIFVARGAHLLRYDTPAVAPVERRASFSLGKLDWEALAPDGRPWASGGSELVLSELGANKELRAALKMARGGEGNAPETRTVPSAPTRGRSRWWGYLLGVLFGFLLIVAVLVVWPLWGLLWAVEFAMRLVAKVWYIVTRRFARRAWTAAHAPVDASAFAGVDPRIIGQVRRWLAHTYRVPASRFGPQDTLASLEPLRCYRLFSPGITLEKLLFRVWPESTTVGDLVQRVDAALAADPLPCWVDLVGQPWEFRFEVADNDNVLFPSRETTTSSA